MFRHALASVAALALTFGVGSAAEVKGTVKSVDASAKSITLSIDGKEQTFNVGKDASFSMVTVVQGKKNKTTEDVKPIDGGLTGVKVGAAATLLTDSIDSKDVVTSIKVSGGNAPAKKKKKKAK